MKLWLGLALYLASTALVGGFVTGLLALTPLVSFVLGFGCAVAGVMAWGLGRPREDGA